MDFSEKWNRLKQTLNLYLDMALPDKNEKKKWKPYNMQ